MPRNNRNPRTTRSQSPKGRDSQRPTTARSRRGRERHLSVRGELRDKPDLDKIARAVIAMAMAQAEADAQSDITGDAADQPDEEAPGEQ